MCVFNDLIDFKGFEQAEYMGGFREYYRRQIRVPNEEGRMYMCTYVLAFKDFKGFKDFKEFNDRRWPRRQSTAGRPLYPVPI